MNRLISLLILINLISCSTEEKLRFRKDEFETFTKTFSYRVIKKAQLKEYITGGIEEPSIDCELGFFDKSKDFFQTNYTIYNRKPAFWVKSAVCAQREGREELSLFLYKKAQRIFKGEKSAALELNLAIYFHSLKNYSLAYEQYLRAQAIESENLLLKVNFSRLLIKIGHFNESLELLRGIYQIAAYDNEVLHLLGTTLLLLEKYELSLKTFSQISSPDVRRRDIAINFALAHYLSGNKSEALSIMENSDKSSNSLVEKRYASVLDKIKS